MKSKKLWEQFLEKDENGNPVLEKSPIAGISRRSFLAALGYTAAGLSLMSCRVPEQKIIPHIKRPPELTPGVASWYASTCAGCSAGCGVLVKVRDGRPIKLEGNPKHPVSKGGLCSVAHSLVFGLYDSERLQKPLISGKESDWKTVDAEISKKLDELKQNNGKVRFLSGAILSPTSRELIDKFLEAYTDSKQVVYEPVSTSAIRLAHEKTHGAAITPAYRFDQAKLILSFDADFLGTWISPVEFTRGYSKSRDLKDGQKAMSRHIQIESRMSLTGANADSRVKASFAEQAEALVFLSENLSAKGTQSDSAESPLPSSTLTPQMIKRLEEFVAELKKHSGESLVVSGSNDPNVQQIVNAINESLGSYGKTIDLSSPSLHSQGNDTDFAGLIDEMKSGDVAALFMLDVNPVYDSYASKEFEEALKNVPLKVSFNPTLDETSVLADYACPNHHFLEAWDDAEASKGTFSFNQPTIAPLFKTRAYQESLMAWSGEEGTFYDKLRTSWEEKLFGKQSEFSKFDDFWDQSLHDGVFLDESTEAGNASFNEGGLEEAITRLKERKLEEYSLDLYQKPSLRDGKFANSPWLQEMPDPISKVTWDNYAAVSKATAEKLGVKEGQVVSIKKGDKVLELPVLIQPGQADGSVAVAVGYGRAKAGKAGNDIGKNAFPFVEFADGTFRYRIGGVAIEPTAKYVSFAKMQVEESAHDRPLIKEFSLAKYAHGEAKTHHTEFEKLFDAHDYPDHKWGMTIDLNACTGCNACVLSCQAENNIPVVGKDEVGIQRDMHWIRIDRYYEEKEEETKTRFQPLPCMHCENASCEMVCPVLATAHSTEGLNMQVYNRCVGTRYCANNCAYKVRRFNWFEYPHEDPIANLALNPDVTVRSRGVMEKCTLCVQRIEEKKVLARNEKRPVKDGEIQTACQQSCPANAITFGDMKDLESKVVKLKKSDRDYLLLEDLNTKPSVSYLAKVVNAEETEEEGH